MMSQDYWSWPESNWKSADVDRPKAKTVTAGVDVGVNSTQAAIMCDGELYCYANIRTGRDSRGSAARAMEQALESTGMKVKDIQRIVATGYGREKVPFAQK